MQRAQQSRELRVTSRAQVAALESPLRARLLIACIPEDRSLTDLQRLSGQTLPKLHYHVTRLLDAGLLQVASKQARAGRPVRRFRATAASFLVPQEFLGELPGDAMASELRNLLQKNRGDPSLRYAPDERGNLALKLVRDTVETPPRTIELWQILRLDLSQREALARELRELFDRYAKAGRSGPPILAHAAFALRV